MVKSKFAGLFEAEPAADTTETETNGRVELAPSPPPLEPVMLAKPMGRPPGKRSDPAYKQFSVLMRKDTQRAAANILRARDDGQDFSGLVQELVSAWLQKQTL